MEKYTNVLKYKSKESLSMSTCWVGSENVLLQLGKVQICTSFPVLSG